MPTSLRAQVGVDDDVMGQSCFRTGSYRSCWTTAVAPYTVAVPNSAISSWLARATRHRRANSAARSSSAACASACCYLARLLRQRLGLENTDDQKHSPSYMEERQLAFRPDRNPTRFTKKKCL